MVFLLLKQVTIYFRFNHLTKPNFFPRNRLEPTIIQMSNSCFFLVFGMSSKPQLPHEDDWDKLKCVLKYLFSTCCLTLTLSATSLTDIKWYVDASHQTHDDCKLQRPYWFPPYIGKGATTSSSDKHKVPSKSSIESKIIRLHDKSSNILWTRHFLEAQGYTISSNIVYQDNMRTLSKWTKHIKASTYTSDTFTRQVNSHLTRPINPSVKLNCFYSTILMLLQYFVSSVQ